MSSNTSRPSANVACAVVLVVYLGTLLTGWLAALLGLSPDGWPYYLLHTLSQWAFAALPVFYYYGRVAPERAPALRLNRLDFACGLLTVLVAVASVFALNYIAIYWTLLLNWMGLTSLQSGMVANSPATLVCMLVTVVCTAAVVEELVFRGLLLPSLEPMGERRAVAYSALVFMLMHGSVEVVPTHCLIGAALALLALKTGCLYAPMLFHGVYNGVVVLLQYAARGQSATLPTAREALGFLPSAVLWLLVWHLLLRAALRRGARVNACRLPDALADPPVCVRWYIALPLGLLLVGGFALSILQALSGGGL